MTRAEFERVLAEHPLVAGEGRYAGLVICDGCHIGLGNPTKHLADALAEALDPSYRPSEPRRGPNRPEYREAYLDRPPEALETK
jgi:hypothetical protein